MSEDMEACTSSFVTLVASLGVTKVAAGLGVTKAQTVCGKFGAV